MLRSSFIIIMALALVASSCRKQPVESSSSRPGEITVAAAANLSEAFAELGQRFKERTGIGVRYSFGATSDLERQIENGAPFDLFAAADLEHIERLARAGLILEGSQLLYARGRLVLWTPQGSRLTLNRIEELRRSDVERIAIAKPDVAPYGRAAVEALSALGLWQEIEPKVIYGQNVSQTKQYVATGNADAGLLPRSLVKEGEGHFIEIDARLHRPINQSLAVIKASDKQDAAKQFATFVLSPEGQALLESYGYERAVTGER